MQFFLIITKGPFIIAYQKKEKRIRNFLRLLFVNNIYMKKIQVKYIEESKIRSFMQWWWFFTCAYNYAWIFWFININKKMPKWFLKLIKHVFLHDHFRHMWLASWVRNFEPNEYKKLPQWFNKGIISLVVLCIKLSKLWNFHIFIFSSSWPNKHVVA